MRQNVNALSPGYMPPVTANTQTISPGQAHWQNYQANANRFTAQADAYKQQLNSPGGTQAAVQQPAMPSGDVQPTMPLSRTNPYSPPPETAPNFGGNDVQPEMTQGGGQTPSEEFQNQQRPPNEQVDLTQMYPGIRYLEALIDANPPKTEKV